VIVKQEKETQPTCMSLTGKQKNPFTGAYNRPKKKPLRVTTRGNYLKEKPTEIGGPESTEKNYTFFGKGCTGHGTGYQPEGGETSPGKKIPTFRSYFSEIEQGVQHRHRSTPGNLQEVHNKGDVPPCKKSHLHHNNEKPSFPDGIYYFRRFTGGQSFKKRGSHRKKRPPETLTVLSTLA